MNDYKSKNLDRKEFFYYNLAKIKRVINMLWLISIVDLLFQVFMLMLFIRILSSWLPQLMEYRFMQFIAFYTDPYLNIFRRIIPPLGIMDISPIFAFFSLSILKDIILFLLR